MQYLYLRVFLFFSIMNQSCSLDSLTKVETNHLIKVDTLVSNFMVSNDKGLSWYGFDDYLPKDFEIISSSVDNDLLYLGSVNGEVLIMDLQNPKKPVKDNVMVAILHQKPTSNHRVSGLFSTTSGMYAFVDQVGLFKKLKNSSFWQPMTNLDGIYFVDQLVEDKEGNIYIACHYGVYRSSNQGRSWDRIFKYGYAKNIIVLENSMFINGINGLYRSIDQGKSWSSINMELENINENELNNYHLLKSNNTINVFKQPSASFFQTSTNQTLLASNDDGKTWSNHTALKYLNSKTNIQSIFFDQSELFCTTKNFVMYFDKTNNLWKEIIYFLNAQGNESAKPFLVGGLLVCIKTRQGC